ncbi:hypothetical protein [Halosegnis sp.]|uniref:hypothetical protein n=1 Tax=Halosegnis sp. TaxID=2864959 RepID=UPI0035D4D5BB
MSSAGEPSTPQRPERRSLDAWTRLRDVELRGRWFSDGETFLRCRGFTRGAVVFRDRSGERVVLPRAVAQTMRLVAGPGDDRPPTADQLPDRL